MPSLEANQLLAAAVDASDSRKAEDIRILALDPSESALTDYFLICNGTNERQNAAIADEIEGRLKREFGVYPNSVEGRRQGEWILMDYVDFVVHIFMPEKRAYYGLERLRKSAKSLTPGELNEEISRAIQESRRKKPIPVKAARGESGEDEEAGTVERRGGKTGRKSSAKVSIAIADAEPVKKRAAKKAAVAKKAATKGTATAKRNVTPQPVSRPKAGKKAAKKATRKTGK